MEKHFRYSGPEHPYQDEHRSLTLDIYTGKDSCVFEEGSDTGDYASLFAIERENGTKPFNIAHMFLDRATLIALRDALIETFPLAVAGNGLTVDMTGLAGTPEPDYVRESFATLDPVEPENYSDGTSNYDPNPWDVETDVETDAVLAADHAGFERGYAAAVDDLRHGLWHDEVSDVWKRGYETGVDDSNRYIDGSSLSTPNADSAYDRTRMDYASDQDDAPAFMRVGAWQAETRLLTRGVIRGEYLD